MLAAQVKSQVWSCSCHPGAGGGGGARGLLGLAGHQPSSSERPCLKKMERNDRERHLAPCSDVTRTHTHTRKEWRFSDALVPVKKLRSRSCSW